MDEVFITQLRFTSHVPDEEQQAAIKMSTSNRLCFIVMTKEKTKLPKDLVHFSWSRQCELIAPVHSDTIGYLKFTDHLI